MDSDLTLPGEDERSRPSPAEDVGRAPAAPEVAAVEQLGRYSILERIGAGATGVVFSAYDPDLDRRVAIKLLDTRRRYESRDQLLQEAQALARLSHSNVVAIHDVGVWDGRPFIAMEHVDGPTLRTWLADIDPGDPDLVAKILDVMVGAGEGLAAAHDAGLVHRDFKPANVLVAPGGRAQVVDFGLAAPLSSSHSRDSSAEESSSASKPSVRPVGTPAYMAPEVFAGEPPDVRADVYSYCVTLYEALYGERPFAGDSPLAIAMSAERNEVRPEPASRRMPAWLRSVVLQGLQPDPARRLPNMAETLRRLGNDPRRRRRRRGALAAGTVVVAGLGVLAGRQASGAERCDDGPTRIQSAWSRDDAATVRATMADTGLPYAEETAGAVVAHLDAYAADWRQRYEAGCKAHEAGSQSDQVYDLRMACLDDRLTEIDALVVVLADADEGVVANAIGSLRVLSALTICDDITAMQRGMPPADGETRAQVSELQKELTRVRALTHAGRFSGVRTELQRLARRADKTGYRPLQADVRMELALADARHDDPGEARHNLEQAWAFALQADHRHVAVSAALASARNLATHAREFEAATLRVRDAETILAKVAERDPKTAGLLSVDLALARATVETRQGHKEAALQILVDSLPKARELHDADSLALAQYLDDLGNAAHRMERYAEAMRHLERVVEIREQRFGQHHPSTAYAHNNLALLYKNAGKSEQAIAHFLLADETLRAQFPPGHSGRAMVQRNLAGAFHKIQNYAEAVRWSELSFGESPLPKTLDPVLQDAVLRYGLSLEQIGRVDDARETLRHGLDSAIATGHGRRIGRLSRALATVEMNHGDVSIAVDLLQNALANFSANPGSVHEPANVRGMLGNALWARNAPGDRSRARALATEQLESARRDPKLRRYQPKLEAWLLDHPLEG
ncbi:MAG: serine/threonine-protein kinase [Myxococcota bacterium]